MLPSPSSTSLFRYILFLSLHRFLPNICLDEYFPCEEFSVFLVRKFSFYEYLLLTLPKLISFTPFNDYFGFPLQNTSLTDDFLTSSFTDYSCLQYISTEYASSVLPFDSFSIRLFLSSWSFRLQCSLLLSRHFPDFSIYFS